MDILKQSEYRKRMQQEVEPELEAIRRVQNVQVQDGQLRVEVFTPDSSAAVLLLLHGFTESSVKFREMIWYFTRAGLTVVAPDQRGHGESLRLVEDPSTVHVERFEDYVEDAQTIVREVIDPILAQRPLLLFGHSMGGAVAAFLAAREPRFSRVLLSSPMISPSFGNIPMWVGKALAACQVGLGRGKKMAFISSQYDPLKDTFEQSCDTCRERFEYYKEKRQKGNALITNGPTYRWVLESIGVTQRLLSAAVAGKIEAEVLLCQAGRDTVVNLPEQDEFISKLKHGYKALFPQAKHEIYFSEDPDMQRYVPMAVSFLAEGRIPENQA